jgi:hypothetical protein
MPCRLATPASDLNIGSLSHALNTIKGYYGAERAPLDHRLISDARRGRGICERCRLRQRNNPATPDHSAAFWREDFKDSLFQLRLF